MSSSAYANMRAQSMSHTAASMSATMPPTRAKGRGGGGAPLNPYLTPVPLVPQHGGFSGLLRKQGAGNSAWKQRYFVLPRDTNRLLWYEDKHEWHAEPAKPHRAVRVVGLGASSTESAQRMHVFEVWANELERSDAPGKARGGVFTRMLRRASTTHITSEAPQKGSCCYRLAAGSADEAAAWIAALSACLPAEQRANQPPATPFRQPPPPSVTPPLASGPYSGPDTGDAEPEPGPVEEARTAEQPVAPAAAPPVKSTAAAAAVASAPPLAAVDVSDADGAPLHARVVAVPDVVPATNAAGDDEEVEEKEDEDVADEEDAEAEAAALAAARAKAATAFADALRLCKQTTPLEEEDDAALVRLASELPAAFVVPDPTGIAPVHWLCAGPDPSVDALDELLEKLPSAGQCQDKRGCMPLHWLAANAAVSAELLLLVLESHEAAAAHPDNFGQLPLHWLCMGTVGGGDTRTLPLLLDAHPAAATHADRQGRTPAHVLCKRATAADAKALRALVEGDAACAAACDKSGQTALHVLCANQSVCKELLSILLEAQPGAAAVCDIDGHVPLHYLAKTIPEGGEMWQLLIAAAPQAEQASAAGRPFDRGAGQSAAGGHASSSPTQPPPVMVAGDGAVKGIRGRVQSVLHAGAGLETRNQDRGLLLFTSSMSAVKVTADACRQAAALLEALLIEVDHRDVFVNGEYANQLRRLHAATLARSESDGAQEAAQAAANPGTSKAGRGLPELPQLYANGTLIGGLNELRALDDEGKLVSTLAPYRLDHQRGREIERRDCDECGGRRFLVCAECNGSRRGKLVFGKYLKCSHCNENGLSACPSCNADGGKPVTAS